MRYREPFTVFARNTHSGKTIYYYRTYDTEGNRTTARSTGQTGKSAAKAYCWSLLKQERLIPSRDLSFAEYATDWWLYDKCRYIKSRLACGGSFSRMRADIQRMNLKKHILPVFGEKPLGNIKSGLIEVWLFSFKEKGLSNVTANRCLGTLRIMLNEAQRLEYIKHNPISAVKPLKAENNIKAVLSLPEVKMLFDMEKSRELWPNPVCYTANLLSACTGMRLGEIQALQVEDVHPDYVHVHRSLDRKYGLKDTKTHNARDIPIPTIASVCLEPLKKINPSGFIFSNDGGKTPVYHKTVTKALYRALNKIGISEEKRKTRNLSFHSWRHTFNSMLRSRVPDSKLKRLTGHLSQDMVEHYTHFDVKDFQDVKMIREELFMIECR